MVYTEMITEFWWGYHAESCHLADRDDGVVITLRLILGKQGCENNKWMELAQAFIWCQALL
jgi:hypothetical protein